MTHRSDALVFFGATGDLAYRQIFPALQALVRHRELDFPVIGVARTGWSLEKLCQRVHDSLRHYGGVDADAFARLTTMMRCVDGDYGDPAMYGRLRQALGSSARPLHYLAVPPSLLETVVRGLAQSGCSHGARIVVEKPFGRDLKSAHALNRSLHDVFDESSIFRIDHYLGKEAVQNLLYFRFANSFLEPIWNRNYICDIQITMAENFGVQGRGAFYDEVGAVRDVVQNHLLQVIALLAMDAPVGHDAESMRVEKLRLFRAIQPLQPADVVRGQFRGYREEPGVAANSRVETFVALRLQIDTWRWAGVPFYVRTGKCLPISASEVIVNLKRPPVGIFDEPTSLTANYFRFRLSPEVVISLGTRVKRHGEKMCGEPMELIARHQPQGEMLPYERLLGEAIRGDSSQFTRDDSVEAAWAVFESVLGASAPVIEYLPGTWGPDTADRISGSELSWHNPRSEQSCPC